MWLFGGTLVALIILVALDELFNGGRYWLILLSEIGRSIIR